MGAFAVSIVGALLDAGLSLDFLHEHPSLPWPPFPMCVRGADGMWHLPEFSSTRPGRKIVSMNCQSPNSCVRSRFAESATLTSRSIMPSRTPSRARWPVVSALTDCACAYCRGFFGCGSGVHPRPSWLTSPSTSSPAGPVPFSSQVTKSSKAASRTAFSMPQ